MRIKCRCRSLMIICCNFLDALGNLGIDYKLMHLMHTAVATVGIRLLVMMLGMLIVDVAIFLTLFLNHTDTTHVVMMGHHRR